MLNIPVIRWGKPYESLEVDEVTHFVTGEPIAKVSQANAGLLQRDMRKADAARSVLREFSCEELIERIKNAAALFRDGTLNVGDGTQTPAEFCRAQSATTGLPEHMSRANMEKNYFVLTHMDQMLDALTRGLDLAILTRGFGQEDRGVIVSYQCQTPALGLVLPSNSPGVHTLWLPVIPMQVGLVLKPGPLEPWTPYRMMAAMVEAGIPPEAFSIYPGGADVGAAVVASVPRVMIFGGTPTVERYKGNPAVQVHGPGFSKILLGDDCVDDWEQYIDLMADSVFLNSGRGCINCSGIWASRHTKEIAQALAERLGPVEVRPPEDPEATLAAFTNRDMAEAIWKSIEADLREDGVTHMTADFGERLVLQERCGYLRPTVVHATSPAAAIASKEYMYPFVSVVECPQEKMLSEIGPTLVASAITNDEAWRKQLIDAVHIDRLNLGPIRTIKLDWLQPHEGNIVDFLYRARAFQVPEGELAAAN
ncbi:MAG: aldehyde dehydrogenase family protein [Planctomycetota bacterium]|nr:MAG: aldehyde dehydrogenase family protein [Planctomycetota bacterium]REJ92884.1 MAG: aldehyde dehydrogenase family protein [Planctomycetota bacterium]